MPPACPMDGYVLCYKSAASKNGFFSPFSHDGVAVAGKRGIEGHLGPLGCSEERDIPPGKPVASGTQNAEVIPNHAPLGHGPDVVPRNVVTPGHRIVLTNALSNPGERSARGPGSLD